MLLTRFWLWAIGPRDFCRKLNNLFLWAATMTVLRTARCIRAKMKPLSRHILHPSLRSVTHHAPNPSCLPPPQTVLLVKVAHSSTEPSPTSLPTECGLIFHVLDDIDNNSASEGGMEARNVSVVTMFLNGKSP